MNCSKGTNDQELSVNELDQVSGGQVIQILKPDFPRPLPMPQPPLPIILDLLADN